MLKKKLFYPLWCRPGLRFTKELTTTSLIFQHHGIICNEWNLYRTSNLQLFWNLLLYLKTIELKNWLIFDLKVFSILVVNRKFLCKMQDVKVYETPVKLVLLLYFLKQSIGINLCKSSLQNLYLKNFNLGFNLRKA